jgi:hypothetical protein
VVQHRRVFSTFYVHAYANHHWSMVLDWRQSIATVRSQNGTQDQDHIENQVEHGVGAVGDQTGSKDLGRTKADYIQIVSVSLEPRKEGG